MKKTFIISSIAILFLTMINSMVYSQDWQWIEKVDSEYNSARVRDFVIADNYIYAIAQVDINLIIEGDTVLPNIGHRSSVLLKYNKESGKILNYKFYENMMFDYIESDHQGNLILCGFYWNITHFDTIQIPQSTYNDIIVAKINYSGDGLWAIIADKEAYLGDAFSLTVDNQGNPVICGMFTKGLSIGGIQLSCADYTDDVFVARINNNGTVDWALSGGGPGQDIYNGRSGVITDDALNVYFTTSTMGEAVFAGIPLNPVNTLNEEINLMKFDKYGNMIWHKTMGGADTDYPNNICLSSEGYLYVTGGVGYFPTFGDTTLNVTHEHNCDMFVSCWDVSGNHVRTTSFGTNLWNQAGTRIKEMPGNKIAFGGYFRGSWETPTGTIYSNSGSMFIAELDATCNLLGAMTLGGPTGLSNFEISPTGYVYLSGSISGYTTVNDSIYRDNYMAKYTYQNLLIEGNIYIDENGNCELDSEENQTEMQYIVQIMPSNELINTDTNGYFKIHVYPGDYTISFPQNNTYYEGDCINTEDVTLNAVDTVQNVSLFLTEESSSINTNNTKYVNSLYPNPTQGLINIDLADNLKEINVRIIDIRGAEILSKNYYNQKNISLDVNEIHKGIYLIYIRVLDETTVHKIIKN